MRERLQLLVVVTIIVVLLALLVPAMNKAIYQAELTVCGARQKAVAANLVSYTFDFKKWYPARGVEQLGRETQGGGPVAYLDPMTVYDSLDAHINYDIRPPLKGYISINKMLQCPFNPPVDMEHNTPDSMIEASYMLLWGWGYNLPGGREKFMNRLGDRFTYRGKGYSLLIGDMDLIYPSGLSASHPDINSAILVPDVWVNKPAWGAFWWYSRWTVLNT